jgi:hypothetical protein
LSALADREVEAVLDTTEQDLQSTLLAILPTYSSYSYALANRYTSKIYIQGNQK